MGIYIYQGLRGYIDTVRVDWNVFKARDGLIKE